MGKAWIDGVAAPLNEAIAAAARLLTGSRLPLFTGLATDVAGVKAALSLARRTGGVVDHAGSDVLYRAVEVLRSAGMFLAAPAEMRRRADRFLVVGGDAATLSPQLLSFLFGGTRDLGRTAEDGGSRKIVWLGAPAGATLPANGIAVEAVPCDPALLSDAVAMIRASLSGRRFGTGPIPAETASNVAAWLGGAGFACIVWSAPALDALGVEMVSGLVSDINLKARASSVPILGSGQAWGAAQIATSVSGFPLRTGFGRGEAEHDAWAFAGPRLVDSGEGDLLVHISALAGHDDLGAHWGKDVPVIALTAADAAWPRPPAVAFAVGLAGRDHPGALWREEAASFVAEDGPGRTADMSAADILNAIAAVLGERPAERAA